MKRLHFYFHLILEDRGLKTYGFPRLLIVFYSIAVSSLIVRLYDYRSSADDFCSKSVCPRVCSH